jgi:hypothetical protein
MELDDLPIGHPYAVRRDAENARKANSDEDDHDEESSKETHSA